MMKSNLYFFGLLGIVIYAKVASLLCFREELEYYALSFKSVIHCQLILVYGTYGKGSFNCF